MLMDDKPPFDGTTLTLADEPIARSIITRYTVNFAASTLDGMSVVKMSMSGFFTHFTDSNGIPSNVASNEPPVQIRVAESAVGAIDAKDARRCGTTSVLASGGVTVDVVCFASDDDEDAADDPPFFCASLTHTCSR